MAKYPESELIVNPDGSIYHLNLKPEHLGDYIITVGDPDRVSKVSQHFDKLLTKVKKREFVTHLGELGNKTITVLSTGMGTDNIEILMNELDALANIDIPTRSDNKVQRNLNIIRLGTSGSMQENLPVNSLLASNYSLGLDTLMAYYEMEQSQEELAFQQMAQKKLGLPFEPYCVSSSKELLQLISGGMQTGCTVTCPGFYAPQGRQLRGKLKLPNLLDQLAKLDHKYIKPTNFEMETAGYYAMGRVLGHACLSVNAIIANRKTHEFSKDPYQVVDKMIENVLQKVADA